MFGFQDLGLRAVRESDFFGGLGFIVWGLGLGFWFSIHHCGFEIS